MKRLHRYDVLIVGAGPVGLMTALMLAERKLSPLIVDRERRTNVHSYALALHPSVIELLNGLGIGQEIESHGRTIHSLRFLESSEVVSELAFPEPGVLVLPQSALEATLEDLLAERHKITVHWQHELDEFTEDEDGVVARVHRLQEIPQGYPVLRMQRLVVGELNVRARYLVGADGVHSSVRAQTGIRSARHGEPRLFSVYEIRPRGPIPDHMSVTIDSSGRVAVLWPMPGGRCRWGFELESASAHDPSLGGLTRLAAQRAPWFDSSDAEMHWTALVRFEDRLAERFGRGCVWLAGDSAHHGNPVGVHSLNAGLLEAHELASRLFEIVRNGANPDVLQEYSRQGLERWRLLLEPGRLLGTERVASAWWGEKGAQAVRCVPLSGDQLRAAVRHAAERAAVG